MSLPRRLVVACLLAVALASTLLVVVEATVSSNFRNFVREKYGEDVANVIARTDCTMMGSFGGGNHKAGQKTSKIPVVFVHGVSNSAANVKPIADTFKAMYGYKDEEVYATTYGECLGLYVTQNGIQCKYMKAIRALVRAVAAYTNSKVNVIGYSLGGPVSRKAMLGGTCVENGEDMGEPLTKIVNVYLGVAGAMHGCKLCTWMPYMPVCSKNNGIGCDSKFLQDINSKQRYEGQKIYVFQSMTDEIVGHIMCGQPASEIAGADNTITVSGLGHVQMCSQMTARTQYNIITTGTKDGSGNGGGQSRSSRKSASRRKIGRRNSRQ